MTLGAKSSEEMQCFKRAVCLVGATAPIQKLQEEARAAAGETKPVITLAKGVDQFRQILELMVQNINEDPNHNLDDFPIIHQILGR